MKIEGVEYPPGHSITTHTGPMNVLSTYPTSLSLGKQQSLPSSLSEVSFYALRLRQMVLRDYFSHIDTKHHPRCPGPYVKDRKTGVKLLGFLQGNIRFILIQLTLGKISQPVWYMSKLSPLNSGRT